jgi:hypothetical protein
LLEAQIEEEEKKIQRCIESVRESLLQQVEPNIKQICFSNAFNPSLYLDNCAKYINGKF